MNCPQCNQEYACPCKHCVIRNLKLTPWIPVGNYSEKCPKCGLTKSLDDWMDEEYRQYKEKEDA